MTSRLAAVGVTENAGSIYQQGIAVYHYDLSNYVGTNEMKIKALIMKNTWIHENRYYNA